MEDKTTMADLTAHLSEVETRFADLAAEYADRDLPEDAEAEWAALTAEIDATKTKIAKRQKREADLAARAKNVENTEDEKDFSFQVKRTSVVPDDPTKLEDYRNRARSLDELEQGYKDGARKILEERFRSSHPNVSTEEAQNDIDRLISMDREVALRTIATSSPKYKKEFETYLKTRGLVTGPEMERTASLTTTAGGFAVPVELDTTLLLTNAGVVNPIRNLARVRQTSVNHVEFINTAGITASYGAEVTEASDGAPVLAQPVIDVEKAQAFVPMSIEIADDWAGIQQDLALCFADAKNQLEASKFLTGVGHASHEPQGLIAVGGATAVVSSATTAVFAVADLYTLEAALSPRYRANASIVGNRAAYQKVRQFDTAGGANLWVQLQNNNPPTLLGYNAYEWSNYASTLTTSASTILTIGDFNYFAIVDRAGMNVEFIPHLFGGSNRYPTGQRGLYMYWRNSSGLLSPSLSSQSAFVSLKLL